MCTLSVSNEIYHKFSHGAVFYTLNGKNVNVMLEFSFKQCLESANNLNHDKPHRLGLQFFFFAL